MIHHHLRRLRRHGQLAAIAPASDGLWAQTAVPPRRGQRARGPDRRRERAAARWPRRSATPSATCTSARGTSSPTSTPARATARPGARAAGRGGRARPGARAGVGGRAGAGLPAPPRPSSRRRATQLVKGTKIQCELDAHGRLMHCHHEKLVIVDDELAFVGGIDLTALAGDRYDSNAHPHKGRDRLARRVVAAARPDRRATSPPTSRCAGRRHAARRSSCPRRRAPRRRHDRPVHPHGARGRLRRAPARRVLDPRELRPRAAQRRAA